MTPEQEEKSDAMLIEKYKSAVKNNYSFYLPSDFFDTLRAFCKENNISQSFFTYAALKKELESREMINRMKYCEPM